VHEAENGLQELSLQDRQEIEDQLQRLLGHPLFQQSKYLPQFLTYIVREALNPKSNGLLKERTLGIEVFDRQAGYDNNADPVVRVTATALRKKLAQYYYESGHQDEIRIELRPGTYIPTFRPSLSKISIADHPGEIFPVQPIGTLPQPEARKTDPGEAEAAAAKHISPRPFTHVPYWLAGSLTIFLLVYWGHRLYSNNQANLEDFWAQAASDSNHVSIVMPVIGSDDLMNAVSIVKNQSARPVLSLEDTNLAARVVGQLQRRKSTYQITSSSDVTLVQLRTGPAVFIGALDNIWTMRLTKELPFIFEESADNRTGRVMEVNGDHKSWSVDIDRPHVRIDRDYGIIAKFESHLTGQTAIVIAGISSQGTQAAGELVTSSEFRAIRPIIAKAKNFEIVIQTDAIDGHSGQPKIIATRIW